MHSTTIRKIRLARSTTVSSARKMHNLHQSKCTYLDELQALDSTNVISTGRRTRGIRVDYANLKVADTEGLDNDSESETEAKDSNERERAVTEPRTRSPERKKVTNIEEEEGGEDEDLGDEDGQDEDLGDDDGDDDSDDD